MHTNAENKLYLAENYCFDSIPKLIHYHQHNSAGNLVQFFSYVDEYKFSWILLTLQILFFKIEE